MGIYFKYLCIYQISQESKETATYFRYVCIYVRVERCSGLFGKGRAVVWMKSYKKKFKLFIQLKLYYIFQVFDDCYIMWKHCLLENEQSLSQFINCIHWSQHQYKENRLPCLSPLSCFYLNSHSGGKMPAFLPWGLLSSPTDVWLRLQVHTMALMPGWAWEFPWPHSEI